MHNGEPYQEKSWNLGPKPIINSTKEIVQGGGLKNLDGLNVSRGSR